MKEVFDFLQKCGVYYLATTDGDQPRVRPFGSLNVFEDKLDIMTGKKKDVARQMTANPKIEISATLESDWIRIQAVAVEDDRREAKVSFLEANPGLSRMYSADDDNMMVVSLKDAVAHFASFGGEPRVVRF